MSQARRDTGDDAAVIEVDSLQTRFGEQVVHECVDLRVCRGELVAIVGGSGSGKSVLLREIIGLHRPSGGSVRLLGTDVWAADDPMLEAVRRRIGVMFQDGALFSSLDVAGNVATPMREQGRIPPEMIAPLVRLRVSMAGLPPEAATKMPAELSGGMRKRAAIARALALEPEVLFLDEPTSGLDPVTARTLDALLASLNRDLGITIVLVTHDIDTLLTIARRMVVLRAGRIVADGAPEEVSRADDEWIREWFGSRRMAPAQLRSAPDGA
ncbi:MAG TPA: ATP-binding cassette domain-containing protein [Zeimonas sp.]